MNEKVFLQTFGWPLPACRQAGSENAILVFQALAEGLLAYMKKNEK